jgi:hypothetical protein
MGMDNREVRQIREKGTGTQTAEGGKEILNHGLRAGVANTDQEFQRKAQPRRVNDAQHAERRAPGVGWRGWLALVCILGLIPLLPLAVIQGVRTPL